MADARAVLLDVEVAIQATRILLNEGLAGIHGQSVAAAQSLLSQYQGAIGIPGQGRALQVAWHELLESHYRAIENLYLGLSGVYAGLMAEAGGWRHRRRSTRRVFWRWRWRVFSWQG